MLQNRSLNADQEIHSLLYNLDIYKSLSLGHIVAQMTSVTHSLSPHDGMLITVRKSAVGVLNCNARCLDRNLSVCHDLNSKSKLR